jgi:dTDP-3-amino-3,4,6-trideoxy-alpha-D-glucopyranose N,N-dimethyltransferase
MFSHTAQYYDTIYLAMKDYGAEAEKLTAFVHQYCRSAGNRLLDVACGTGLHLSYLKQPFQVEGLDLDEQLLAIARQRNPAVPLHHGDMVDFALGRTFDVVTCLFSAIGYVKTLTNLSRAVQCMAQHLSASGVLLIEPWFTPETWRPGTVHARFIDEPDLKIARINTSFVDGRLSSMDMHYLIGTPEGTEHYVERHELGLFTSDEMTHTLTTCGLEVIYDAEGLTGRGLYIGQHAG